MTKPLPSQAPLETRIPKLRAVPGGRTDQPAQADLSEATVLAACLLDASLIAGFDWLKPEHFRLGEHRYTWAALQALQAASQAPLRAVPCGVDVARELQRSGRLADVGGMVALTKLVDATPDVIDLRAHAEAVHAAHQQRAIGAWADSLSATARTTEANPQALLDGATSALASLQAQTRLGQPPGVLLGEAAAAAVDSLALSEPGAARLSTGFRDIDALGGGGPARGALWVLGGRPGEGKTALAQAIAQNVAWARESAAFFSLEMSRAELGLRALACESGCPVNAAGTPEEIAALREAADRIRRLPLWIDDTPGLSLDDLRQRVRTLAVRARSKGRPLRLVVVDYLQLVRVQHIPGRKRSDEIAEVSTTLKALARELDLVVLALAQLNRESEREARRPRMTDLRDCGQIEQDADWIGILWRSKETPAWQTDLAICKQRTGPKTADLRLGWQPEIVRFDDA